MPRKMGALPSWPWVARNALWVSRPARWVGSRFTFCQIAGGLGAVELGQRAVGEGEGRRQQRLELAVALAHDVAGEAPELLAHQRMHGLELRELGRVLGQRLQILERQPAPWKSSIMSWARGSASMRLASSRSASGVRSPPVSARVDSLASGGAFQQEVGQARGQLVLGERPRPFHQVEEVRRLEHALHHQADAVAEVAAVTAHLEQGLVAADLAVVERAPVGATAELADELGDTARLVARRLKVGGAGEQLAQALDRLDRGAGGRARVLGVVRLRDRA